MRSQYETYKACFLRNKAKDLQRVARRDYAIQQELTIEDLAQEAWLTALDIERKRGYPINFADLHDQNLIMAWLSAQLKYGGKSVRCSVRIDEELESDDGKDSLHPLLRSLSAPINSDPLQSILCKEEIAYRAVAIPPIVKISYSEAAAYAVIMVHFEGSLITAAAYLAISIITLNKRHLRANDWAKIQPSLFDGIVFIELDFLPPQGRIYQTKTEMVSFDGMQAAWPF